MASRLLLATAGSTPSISSCTAAGSKGRLLVHLKPSQFKIITTRSRRFHGAIIRRATEPLLPSSPTTSAQPVVQKRVSLARSLLLSDRHPVLKWAWRGSLALVFSVTSIVGGLLIWDATTYRSTYVHGIPINPLALNPTRGGPKNLKIASILVDDEESDDAKELEKKPKLVIVGGGWGAVGLIKQLQAGAYHVCVVSDANYNLFTPLLPSAAVGTLEARSLVEPIRKIIGRVKGHYLQGKAVGIDMSERLIEISADGQGENFYVPYDKLVIACGSVSNDHGVPGLENCYQLKTIEDSLKIRGRILRNFENASLPSTTPEEREKLLNFVVCGGGPTGVEFASELYDMISEDVTDYFPKLLREDARVHIIQSRDHILNTYSEKISKYAEHRFSRHGINTILNARVKEVGTDHVSYTTKDETGKTTEHTIPSGFTLWSTGIAMNPFTKLVASLLPNQYHKHALEVDSHLRVKGAPTGTVYCIGDASTIETNLQDHLWELIDLCDENKDGKINFDEFEFMLKRIKRLFPTSQLHIEKVRDVFERYDDDKDGAIGLNELATMFQKISSRLTALPATAQVAEQQGKYLGKKFARLAAAGHNQLQAMDIQDDIDDIVYEPFSYRHLGSLAYIGNSAVFDFNGWNLAGGLAAMYLWRSIYWSESVSLRMRLSMMLDWIKRGLFGRDLSNFYLHSSSPAFKQADHVAK